MIGGSLFSGIEGLGLGLLWSGLITSIAFQVEMDSFCQRVLAARFPDVDRSIQDVRLASAQSLRPVDLLFGGPPCQDVSGAGKGVGLTGARSGLVAEMLRLADELRPRVVLVENVASGARRWVCPVRGSLEALGYRTAALNIGVDDCGGPHRRKRIFILAYSNELQRGARAGVDQARHSSAPPVPERSEVLAYTDRGNERLEQGRRRATKRGAHPTESERSGEALADAASGVRFGEAPRQAGHAAQRDEGVAHAERSGWDERPGVREERGGIAQLEDCGRGNAQPGLGGEPHGIPARVARWPAGPAEEQHAWEPPRTTKDAKERAAKLKAIGNAVSPIQAYHVGLWARSVLKGAE